MVSALARETAELFGLNDRGVIAPGYRASMNVIDYDNLEVHAPEIVYDLPGGGKRIHQRATGYVAMVVNGEVVLENDEPTDKRPGRLVRGSQEARKDLQLELS